MTTERAKIKVLIVEDEALLALTYESGLQRGMCEVVGIADSGEKALELAAMNPPDIALIDIKIRGEMDGVDVARALRERYSIPVIYVTGNTDDKTKKRAFMTEPLRYLEKPVESEELCHMLAQVIGRAK